MYILVSKFLWIIRQFCIPNPFNVLGNGIFVKINGVEIFLTPDILNIIAGIFLPTISYLLAGLYCDSFNSAQKSIIYMFFFCLNTRILYLTSLAYPMTWLIILIYILYIGMIVFLKILINRNVVY